MEEIENLNEEDKVDILNSKSTLKPTRIKKDRKEFKHIAVSIETFNAFNALKVKEHKRETADELLKKFIQRGLD